MKTLLSISIALGMLLLGECSERPPAQPEWTPFEQRIRVDIPEAATVMDYSRAVCACKRLSCIDALAVEENRSAVAASTAIVKGPDLPGWTSSEMVGIRATLSHYMNKGDRCRRAR